MSETKKYPTKNLNESFKTYKDAEEMYQNMIALTEAGGGGEFTVRNFLGVIRNVTLEKCTVVTELFPKGALEYYGKKNMGWTVTDEDKKKWQLDQRGGEQGDYSHGVDAKIRNIIECLKNEPYSKRAILPIPFANEPSTKVNYKDKGQSKCVRELHFYYEDPDTQTTLSCSGFLRMQNATIYPKNIYYIAMLLEHVAKELNCKVGDYTHFITSLNRDRNASGC